MTDTDKTKALVVPLRTSFGKNRWIENPLDLLREDCSVSTRIVATGAANWLVPITCGAAVAASTAQNAIVAKIEEQMMMMGMSTLISSNTWVVGFFLMVGAMALPKGLVVEPIIKPILAVPYHLIKKCWNRPKVVGGAAANPALDEIDEAQFRFPESFTAMARAVASSKAVSDPYGNHNRLGLFEPESIWGHHPKSIFIAAMWFTFHILAIAGIVTALNSYDSNHILSTRSDSDRYDIKGIDFYMQDFFKWFSALYATLLLVWAAKAVVVKGVDTYHWCTGRDSTFGTSSQSARANSLLISQQRTTETTPLVNKPAILI